MSALRDIECRRRFEFGDNWTDFLSVLDEGRIAAAESSLKEMLCVESLEGQSFLDVGSGSGLFSLAARRLGATVRSFDFDPRSVACAEELKRGYFPDDAQWKIEEGSILDPHYVHSLGKFDVVYSWGVLHHTGAMWLAIERAISCVADPDGKLCIAIYNDQGWKSHGWWFVKRCYNRLPRILKSPFGRLVMAITRLLVTLKHGIKLAPMTGRASHSRQGRIRGMSAKHDDIDWIGGFPYEFSAYDTLVEYFLSRGFSVVNSKRNASHGCNELTLKRIACVE